MAYTKIKKGSKSLPTLDIYQSQISARFFLLQLSWPSEFLPVQDPARYFVNKILEKTSVFILYTELQRFDS